MKKFLIRGTCFVAIGLVLLSVLNFFYVRTNGYKSVDDTFKFYLMPDDIGVVNLGSSHGEYGISYDGIEGITGFNLALIGQSFYYDLMILQKYRDRLTDDCTVIIPISYFSFVQQRDFNDQRKIYYRILDYGLIQKHNPIEYVKFRLFPLLSAYFNAKYLIKDKESIDFDIFWLHKAMGIDFSEDDVEGYRADALGHLKYYRDIQGEGGNEEFNMSNLEGILDYCREEGFKPVLITFPFTEYYNELFSEDFYSDFYATIAGVCDRYDVTYLDYSHDPRFTENLRLFKDSNHLDTPGKEEFTRTLLSDLGLI